MVKQILLTSLLMVFVVGSTFAQPPQRIIVGFERALTPAQQQSTQRAMEELLAQTVQRVKPGNDQRWVIELSTPLDARALAGAIEKLQSLPHVRYAEADTLLHAH